MTEAEIIIFDFIYTLHNVQYLYKNCVNPRLTQNMIFIFTVIISDTEDSFIKIKNLRKNIKPIRDGSIYHCILVKPEEMNVRQQTFKINLLINSVLVFNRQLNRDVQNEPKISYLPCAAVLRRPYWYPRGGRSGALHLQ